MTFGEADFTFGDVNFWAILVAALANMAIGFFWYSPKVFGDQWAEEALHKKIEECKCSVWHIVGAFIIALIMAWVISLIVHWMHIMNVAQGAALGFFFWLGFIATTHLSGVIWGSTPLKVYIINVCYWLLSLIVVTGILSVWQ